MMAPAWPIVLPGGAVKPAIYPTTGLVTLALMNSAARSSASPPISPIITIASVSGSAWNAASASMCVVPMIGSPPMPTAVEKPMSRSSYIIWYVSVPDFETRPIRPEPAMSAGMMPALDWPGLATPGQLGPTIRVRLPWARLYAHASAVSCTGMPSVMTIASGMAASTASITAPLANLGGTKMTFSSAPVSATASRTELTTGSDTPSKSALLPPLPGVTPPTTVVPARNMRRVCLEPSEPVMPCTMTLESLVSQIAMSDPRSRELGRALGGTVHCVHPLDERVVGQVEDPTTLLGVVAVESDDERLGDRLAALVQQVECGEDAVGYRIAGRDAAEDIDEHALHGRVGEHDLE